MALLLCATSLPAAPQDSSPRLAVIAHRGASDFAPENTLAAFKKAIELGATFLELDVRQTKDSVLVVIHDETIDRTTDGEGKIGDFTYEELKGFDAGSWFSKKFQNERIPRLEEVFALLDDSTRLLIEIKEDSSVYPNIERRVVQTVVDHRLASRVILKSFEDGLLARLRSITAAIPLLKVYVGQVPLLPLVIGKGISIGSPLDQNVSYLQAHWFGLTKKFIEKAHAKGFRVFVWDVNDAKRMRELIQMGVDGIETDNPKKLLEVIASVARNE